jgi:hypothetical protein
LPHSSHHSSMLDVWTILDEANSKPKKLWRH